jgi:gliding motility-associated lipoprotein GldH
MRILFLIGTIVIFISCDSSIVFEEYKSFENQKWNTDSIVLFNYFITDTTSKNIIKIKLRHTVEYEFQNLFLFIKAEKKDTIEIQLANKEGRWMGKGVGDIRTVEFVYKNKEVFSKKGDFIIEIEQAMRYGDFERIQQLKNIEAIGLSIEKQND